MRHVVPDVFSDVVPDELSDVVADKLSDVVSDDEPDDVADVVAVGEEDWGISRSGVSTGGTTT